MKAFNETWIEKKLLPYIASRIGSVACVDTQGRRWEGEIDSTEIDGTRIRLVARICSLEFKKANPTVMTCVVFDADGEPILYEHKPGGYQLVRGQSVYIVPTFSVTEGSEEL